MNCALTECARCILSTSKLREEFWAEIVNTACYLTRSHTISLDMKIREELWSNKPTDYSLFVCSIVMLYTWVPRGRKMKIGKNSNLCVFQV